LSANRITAFASPRSCGFSNLDSLVMSISTWSALLAWAGRAVFVLSSTDVGRDGSLSLCSTDSGVRSFRFSVKPSVLRTRFRCVHFHRGHSALAGPARFYRSLFRSCSKTAVRPNRTTSREVCLPFSVCRSCCAIQGSQPGTIPLRRSILRAKPPCRLLARVSRHCGFFAWRSPCVAPTRSDLKPRCTPVRGGSCAAVSLARGVPLPAPCRTFTRPGRHLLSIRSGNAHGILFALRSVPCFAGPGVCDDLVRSAGAVRGVSTVHPTCRYQPRSAYR